MANEAVSLFGFHFSQSEFAIVEELIKVTLLTIGTAISVLVFNASAKRREQDSALFNEVVKGRISALHEVNSSLILLIADYLRLLETFMRSSDTNIYAEAKGCFDGSTGALSAWASYCKELPSRQQTLEAEFQNVRYRIGERGFFTLMKRLHYFTGRVYHLREYYQMRLGDCRTELDRAGKTEHLGGEEGLALAVAQIVTNAGRKEIYGLIDDIHDDFEKVAKRKGRSRAFRVPVNVDSDPGMFRFDPIDDEVTANLSILLAQVSASTPGKGKTKWLRRRLL